MSLTPGEAQEGNSNSTKTFVTALVANAGLLCVEVGVFVILRSKLDRIYSPRTFLPPPDKRSEELPKSWWKWLPATILSRPEEIIHKNGLDAYMFLRFLKMLMWIFTVFTVSTFIVIFPVNAVGIDSGRDALDRLSWTNVAEASGDAQKRFAAHVIMIYLLTFFVFFMIWREMKHFVHMRHQFLVSKSHSRLAQARTVLITAVPDELADEEALSTFASFIPGGIDNMWIYRDTRILNDMFAERQDACAKLEAAESTVLKLASKVWRQRQKEQKKRAKHRKDEEGAQPELVIEEPTKEALYDLVPDAKRPKHRTGFLGLFGQKVDTIDWCKSEILRLNNSIKDAREHIVKGKFLGSIFIRCNTQVGAHVLAQCVPHHEPLAMYDRWIETSPADVVWQNLDDGAIEMRSRQVLSWILTIGLIIVWGFPVAFIGTISNLDDLCNNVRWLRWVCTAPTPVPSIIQGILPPVLLAILFALLPLILKALSWYQCIPRYSLISISVYKRFFLFLLVHGFLIVTLSSGITKAIQDIIANPTSAVQSLAGQLPGASIFFLTYIVTQGLAGAGMALAQLVPLILHFVRKWFLGRTPRQAYSVTFLMPAADFGIMLPRLSLLATITFVYSVLSPLINLLALVCYTMFYIAWKFLFAQVFDQPDQSETGGLYFPMAVSNLFVGLYIEQICLACLFFLKSSVARTSSIVEGVLMLALFFITLGMHIFLQKSFDPITHYLPMSLASKRTAKKLEMAKKNKEGVKVEDEVDMFRRQHAFKSVRKRIRLPLKKLDEKLDTIKGKVKEEILKSEKDKKEDKDKNDHDDHASVSSGVASRSGSSHSKRPSSPPINKDENDKLADMNGGKLEGAPELFQPPSRPASVASNTSKKSKASSVAVKMDSPAAAGVDLSDDSDDEQEDQDDHAFDHPSTYVEQPWIWIPKDTLGLSDVLVEELKSVGVDASNVGATMDEKGIVEVTRNPPDEDWLGGHDR